MNLITLLDRVGREINQQVFDNTKTVTRDDMINAFNECNDDLSDLNLPFNEATPVTGTWTAGDPDLIISSEVGGSGLTDFDRVRRLEIDSVKASPLHNYDQLDKLRGSFNVTDDASFPVYPAVYMHDHGRLFRWPYNESKTYKLWYYKELAALTAGVDQSVYTAATSTYTVLTSISENADDRQTFTPTSVNQAGIIIYIDTDGGEPLTVTVHNSSNVSQGSKTIHQPGTGRVMFEIPWTWASGSYHFHVTVTSGTTALKISSGSTLENAYFESWYADTPVIPSRYHKLYFYYATSTAYRKLRDPLADLYNDGKDYDEGGRSLYATTKHRMVLRMKQKLTDDRPRYIQDLLDDDLLDDSDD